MTPLPQHQARVDEDSAIDLEVARERGYRSITSPASHFLDPFRWKTGRLSRYVTVPGLGIPLWTVEGEQPWALYRPDRPVEDNDGDPVKYLWPAGKAPVLDVPPRCRQGVADVARSLWVAEGVLKADAAASAGLCAVGVLGAWGWLRKGWRLADWSAGRTGHPLPCWAHVELVWRDVVLVPDSDSRTNWNVYRGWRWLADYLKARGAFVKYAPLPSVGGGEREKVGLDDYFAAGHDVDDLGKLVTIRSSSIRPPRPDVEPAF
jgi:hypothetical protein